jgi:hypothetical protein
MDSFINKSKMRMVAVKQCAQSEKAARVVSIGTFGLTHKGKVTRFKSTKKPRETDIGDI